MKISHESPLSMLEHSRVYNDYDYCLVHLLDEIPQYHEFFVDSLKMGREVILDNSIFELGTAFDMNKYAEWVKKLVPTEYILPDALEDSISTITNEVKWKTTYADSIPQQCKSIGVAQGRSYEEIVGCYRYLDEIINVDKLAISFDYSYYQKVFPHPNKWVSFALGRVHVLSRMLEEGIINQSKPHHLLGCSLPIEFLFYRNGFDWIESVDTSNPIVHGLKNIMYESTGLMTKESTKLVNLINAQPDNISSDIIDLNIDVFRQIVTGDYE
ncbi:MAG: hypothetical protein ACO3UU_16335 [Minisyncoccia bacterium]